MHNLFYAHSSFGVGGSLGTLLASFEASYLLLSLNAGRGKSWKMNESDVLRTAKRKYCLCFHVAPEITCQSQVIKKHQKDLGIVERRLWSNENGIMTN